MTDKPILVVEDDPLVRRALVRELRRAGHKTEWKEMLADARRWLSGGHGSPAALVLDLLLPDGAGDELIATVRQMSETCRILVVSGHLDGARACALLRQGVISIMKPVGAASIAGVLTDMLATREGEPRVNQAAPFPPLWDTRDTPMGPLRKVRLTRREQLVIDSILLGAANKEIALKLGCSVKTVEFHVTNLLRKTGASSRMELLHRLMRVSSSLGQDGESPPFRETRI